MPKDTSEYEIERKEDAVSTAFAEYYRCPESNARFLLKWEAFYRYGTFQMG